MLFYDISTSFSINSQQMGTGTHRCFLHANKYFHPSLPHIHFSVLLSVSFCVWFTHSALSLLSFLFLR